MAESDLNFIDAGGLRFGYLASGEGPLVLLLHGFPDTAHTWDDLRPRLANAGYRAVAPFLRGYAPTEIPQAEDYGPDTLGGDTLALIAALGEEAAIVVGHDWGASAAYSAATLGPQVVGKLVTVAIPHPGSLTPTPATLWAARHFFALGRKGAARWVPDDDFAYIDELVQRWSPTWAVPAGETDAVKQVFRDPKSLDAALGYYRAFSPVLPRSLRGKIQVPAVAFAGRDDILPPAAYERARKCYGADYEIVEMPGGHFMHREHPEHFARELLRVLGSPAA